MLSFVLSSPTLVVSVSCQVNMSSMYHSAMYLSLLDNLHLVVGSETPGRVTIAQERSPRLSGFSSSSPAFCCDAQLRGLGNSCHPVLAVACRRRSHCDLVPSSRICENELERGFVSSRLDHRQFCERNRLTNRSIVRPCWG